MKRISIFILLFGFIGHDAYSMEREDNLGIKREKEGNKISYTITFSNRDDKYKTVTKTQRPFRKAHYTGLVNTGSSNFNNRKITKLKEQKAKELWNALNRQYEEEHSEFQKD